jgi:hypothetical protein
VSHSRTAQYIFKSIHFPPLFETCFCSLTIMRQSCRMAKLPFLCSALPVKEHHHLYPWLLKNVSRSPAQKRSGAFRVVWP